MDRNRRWWVSWSPAAVYPGLRSGEHFALSAVWPARAAVLAADGTTQLSSPAMQAQSGSLALLTGTVVAATKEQAKALGAPYRPATRSARAASSRPTRLSWPGGRR